MMINDAVEAMHMISYLLTTSDSTRYPIYLFKRHSLQLLNLFQVPIFKTYRNNDLAAPSHSV